jgi:general secretion pathway protein G
MPPKPKRDYVYAGELGYTLMELLIVLAILGLLISLAAPRMLDYFGQSKTRAAEIEINTIKGALDLYRLDVGRYPATEDGLKALISKPAKVARWHGPYLDRNDGIIDPWGRQFLYKLKQPNGPPVIASLGADGKFGGLDEDQDLTSVH